MSMKYSIKLYKLEQLDSETYYYYYKLIYLYSKKQDCSFMVFLSFEQLSWGGWGGVDQYHGPNTLQKLGLRYIHDVVIYSLTTNLSLAKWD